MSYGTKINSSKQRVMEFLEILNSIEEFRVRIQALSSNNKLSEAALYFNSPPHGPTPKNP